MPKWVKTKKAIRHTWKCPGNGCCNISIVSPYWYQDNGIPTCHDCHCDMIYAYTEIKEE